MVVYCLDVLYVFIDRFYNELDKVFVYNLLLSLSLVYIG